MANQYQIAPLTVLQRDRAMEGDMGSPIFDATFGTGRFKHEEPMKGGDAALPRPEVLTQGPGSECDRSGAAPSPEPQDVQKLISELRELGELYATDDVSNAYPGVGELMQQAAAALAQSDAGQEPGNDFPDCIEKTLTDLYTAPPRPDASGLIEAAEAELNEIRDCMIEDREHYGGLIDFAGDIERVAEMLRSRAADRSGK